jgi:ADP-ribose pyrophosphatase YjhB (NUDIX family)
VGKGSRPTIRVGGFVTDHGRILLVRQQRAADPQSPASSYWLLPGGGVQFGESLAEALRREVREELGITLRVGRPIALVESISPDPAYQKHVLHVILTAWLPGDVDAAKLAPHDPAVLEAALFQPGDLASLALRPPLAKHLIAFLRELPSGLAYLGRQW